MENLPKATSSKVVPPPQSRVIGGSLYSRDAIPYAHDIRVHDLGHGHLEALVMPRYAWTEVECLAPSALADLEAAKGCIWVNGGWVPHVPTEAEKLDQLTRNKERSSRRARTQVRRLCKSKGLSVLLTLTYRENQTDRARMARDFDVFIKRVRRVVPSLQYVCVFEKQKRGAWHAHIAVPRVLSHYLHKGHMVRSYDLLRSMWRGVVGADNGNVDVSRNKRVARSSAKLAAYVSKYISKGFGDCSDGGDSYRASGRALPAAVVVRSAHPAIGDAIVDLLELLGGEISASRYFHHAVLDCGGYFVSLSP